MTVPPPPHPNVGPSSAPDTTCRGPDKEISTAEGCEANMQELKFLRFWAGLGALNLKPLHG